MSRVQILSSLPITAQKSSNEESILDLSFFNKIGHTYNSEIYDILRYSIYVQNQFGFKNVLFLAFSFFLEKIRKELLVQYGRTWVSKTQCRRFKSYRAWCHSCLLDCVKIPFFANNWAAIWIRPPAYESKKEVSQKKEMLINQKSNWSPRLYCK